MSFYEDDENNNSDEEDEDGDWQGEDNTPNDISSNNDNEFDKGLLKNSGNKKTLKRNCR